jgi:hypothetical protein
LPFLGRASIELIHRGLRHRGILGKGYGVPAFGEIPVPTPHVLRGVRGDQGSVLRRLRPYSPSPVILTPPPAARLTSGRVRFSIPPYDPDEAGDLDEEGRTKCKEETRSDEQNPHGGTESPQLTLQETISADQTSAVHSERKKLVLLLCHSFSQVTTPIADTRQFITGSHITNVSRPNAGPRKGEYGNSRKLVPESWPQGEDSIIDLSPTSSDDSTGNAAGSNVLARRIQELEAELAQLCSPGATPKGYKRTPTFQVFNLLNNDKTAYLAEPTWAKKGGDTYLEGHFPVANETHFLERQGNIAFVVYPADAKAYLSLHWTVFQADAECMAGVQGSEWIFHQGRRQLAVEFAVPPPIPLSFGRYPRQSDTRPATADGAFDQLDR